MLYYHGTTSSRASAILAEGFRLPAYLAPDPDDASHYAACGGEWDLQDREEAYHRTHGEWPRDAFDFWEMARRLYPQGDAPVLVVVDVPGDVAVACLGDSGASGAIVIESPLPPSCAMSVEELSWDADDDGPPRSGGPSAPRP